MAASAAVHSVHIYDSDSALISRLCGIVSASLRVGDSVLVVATPQHRNSLVTELEGSGVDVRGHAREGRFTMVDAYELLDSIVVDGKLDPVRFDQEIGVVLTQLRAKSKSSDQRFMIFGEMVDILWERGHKHTALEIENLWNRVLTRNSFHLHCGYFRERFIGDEVASVCEIHSHLLQ